MDFTLAQSVLEILENKFLKGMTESHGLKIFDKTNLIYFMMFQSLKDG